MELRPRPVVFITGASSGIGLALSKLLVKEDKFFLILTARKESLILLKETFGDNKNILYQELDLRKQEEIIEVAKKINQEYQGVDILINNAAIIYRAVVEHVLDSEEKTLMQVNYFAPRELIRLFLPNMKKKGSGKIINVSSVGGMMAMPTMSSYSASKFALEGMTEALWYEVRPLGIHSTLIEIGFVNSESFKKLIPTKKVSSLNPLYREYYESMGAFIEKIMNITYNTPEKIASKIYKKTILKEAPLRVLATIDAYFFSFLRVILPQRFYHYLLYKLLPHHLRRLYRKIMIFMTNLEE